MERLERLIQTANSDIGTNVDETSIDAEKERILDHEHVTKQNQTLAIKSSEFSRRPSHHSQ